MFKTQHTNSDSETNTDQPLKRLLILDSGVGGLSIAKQIRVQHPNVEISYIADNAQYPYGTKDEEALIQRLEKLSQQFLKTQHADAIVIACNTASTLVLPHLRERLSIPIIGVVPAIKPAAKHSESKVIGLLATPGTVTRQYTQKLIEDYAPDCEVIKVGSSELVDLAEKHLANSSTEKLDFNEVLEPFWKHPRANDIDTIVLGCTHFPLVKNQLQASFNQSVNWVDSGEAVAKQVGRIFSSTDENYQAQSSLLANNTKHQFFFTQQKEISPKLKYSLFNLGMQDINFFNCD